MNPPPVFQLPPDILDSAETAARAGARELLRHWRNLDADQVDEKARNDLVTVADRDAEAAVIESILGRFPDHAVLSEESGWTARDDAAPTWIVDPLDGTTNFVHGLPQFAVSVAVTVHGAVEAGVILDPIRDDLFTARRGAGAHWNGRPCRVSDRTGLRGALLATGFPFRAHAFLEAYLSIFRDVFLRAKAIRRPGAAALDLAWTACGIFDGFFEFKLSPWDVAAGSLLVEEAGGTVTDMDGGREFLDSGNLVCGSTGVHRELLEIVAAHRTAWSALSG